MSETERTPTTTALALADVCSYLEERDIPYSLAYGTLLGAARHGGFIPHDHDVDLYLAKRHSHRVAEMAAHFDVETRYNTPPWGKQTQLQKLLFPGAYDIDFFNEDHIKPGPLTPLLREFWENGASALLELVFCGRPFSCIRPYEEYLRTLYGHDCLEYVDLQYRGMGGYKHVPTSEKVELAVYVAEHAAGFVQPTLPPRRT